MVNFKLIRIVLALTAVLTLTACNLNRPGAMDPDPNNADEQQRMETNQVGPLGNNVQNGDRVGNRGLMPRQNQGAGNLKMHRNTRVEMSEEIAEQVADLSEVARANVLLTDENAYIAVVLANNAEQQTEKNVNKRNRADGMNRMFNQTDEVTDQIKDKIANEVKSVNPDVNNVFVSANPDFMERMNGFVDQVQDGRPIRGFINEFNTLVERIFPTNEENDPNQGIRGTGNTTRTTR